MREEGERQRECSQQPQAVLQPYWLDLYRLFMMSSGCAESSGEEREGREEGGGGRGRDGDKERQSECVCDQLVFAKMATLQIKRI